MTSVDIAREDTKDGGSPTIPPIIVPSVLGTVTTDPTEAAVATNADTNMVASTTMETNTATTTNGNTTNAVNAIDSTATSTNILHRTINTIRKIAKRTPFPVGVVAGAPATVAEENGEEGTTTTTASTLQLVDDTHTHILTQEAETTSAMKVTQDEGEESVSEDDDIERRDATSTASPAATPTTNVPTTTKNTTTAKTILKTTAETDTAKILKKAVEPHLNDVLFVDDNCQEDSKINKKWPGNRQYRAWIQARVFDFQHNGRSEQTRLAKQVSGLVRRQNPAGRFLERLSLPVDSSDNNAVTEDADKKSKSVWVELDETAVLMELSKSLWEPPLENGKLSDKQQQMLLAKQEAALLAKQEAADSGSSPMKNGDKKKINGNTNGNDNGNKKIENEGRTSQHEQQLLLQHAKAALQYGDYFHTLYITPVYSDSQMPSSNTTASMMQEKQQQRNQNHQSQEQQKKKPQRKLTLNKSSPSSFESTKRRPSLDWPNGNNKVEMDEMDIHVRNEDNDDNNSEESVDDSKTGKSNGKSKRKSTGTSNDKKATKLPKRSNSDTFDKPNKPAPKRRKSEAKRNQRSSNGTIVVSPLSTEPARRKPFKAGASGLGFTTTNGDTVAITTKYRGGSGVKDAPKPARSSTTMKKSEKRSSKQTTTDELGLPRGVTMRPSGKWVRNSSACVECNFLVSCNTMRYAWMND
jgi:hypothetical protein